MTQTRVKGKTMARNSSLPIFRDPSEQISPRKKSPSESSEPEQNNDKIPQTGPETKKVMRFKRLQSVEEGPED